MSKKIKTVYDQNPTDADDENETYYFPLGNNQGKAISGSKSQVSDIVATEGRVRDMDLEISALQTGNPVPDPDQTTATWTATLPDDRLTANVQVNNFSGTAYAFVSNDATVPTYPADFTDGTPPSTYLVNEDVVATADKWATTEEVYLYSYSSTSGVELITTVDQESFIAFTPNYTTSPSEVSITTLALNSTNPTTQVDITFSAITPVASTVDRYELIDDDGGSKLQNISAGTTTGVGTFTPGTVIRLRIDVVMADGRRSEGQASSIAMQSASAPGTVRIKSTTLRDSNSGGYESDEDTTPLTVSLERVNGTDGEVTVTVSTVDKTATSSGTVNFTAKSSETVTFGDGSAVDQDVDVTLFDLNETTNKAFQLEIDPGSETGDVTIGDTRRSWGFDNAVLCYINGTGATTSLIVQHTDVELSTNRTSFEGEDYASVSTVSGDTWALDVTPPPGTTYSTTGVMRSEAAGGGGNWIGSPDTYDGGLGPVISWDFQTDAAETNHLWIRHYCDNTNSDSVYVNIDGTDLGAIQVSTIGAWAYHYIGSFTGTTNTQTISFKVREGNFYIDMLVVTPETPATWTPSTADETWITTSPNPKAPGAGAAVDNVSNPTFPVFPTESDFPSGDITLSPADGSTGVSTAPTPYTVTFGNGGFELTNPVFTFTRDSDGTNVPGLGTFSTNTASFVPSSNLDSNTAYTLTLSADYIRNAAGVKLGVNITGWNITTVNTATDLVFDPLALENYANGTAFSITIAEAILNTWRTVNLDSSAVTIVNDPVATNNRKVLRILHRANQAFSPANLWNSFYSTSHIDVSYAGSIYPNSGSAIWDYTGGEPVAASFASREATRSTDGLNEAWMVYSFRLDPNWQFPFAHKLPGLSTGNPLQATHGGPAFAEGLYGFSARLQIFGPQAYPRTNGQPFMIFYEYNESEVQKERAFNITNGSSSSANYSPISIPVQDMYVPPRGKWITIKEHIKLNTTGGTSIPTINSGVPESAYSDSANFGADGNLRDSEIDVWVLEEDWAAPIKVITLRNRAHRWWSYYKIDEISYPYSYVNNQVFVHNQNQNMWITMPQISGSDIDIG